MPNTNDRPSLTKTLDQRYISQHAGGAFEVKDVLGSPGTSPATGTTIDASSLNGSAFQSPNGFEVKLPTGQTQFKDAQGSGQSKELSRYIKGFSNIKYKR